MICSGKTRDGGTCSRRARYGLFCKTHLPPTAESIMPQDPWRSPDQDVIANILDNGIVGDITNAIELAPELPTLYSIVLAKLERGELGRRGIYVSKLTINKEALGESVKLLYNLGLRIMDNGVNVHVYRPRFLSAADKKAWRAKHSRIHEDRLRFLEQVETGARRAVAAGHELHYNKGCQLGIIAGALITTVALIIARMQPIHALM